MGATRRGDMGAEERWLQDEQAVRALLVELHQRAGELSGLDRSLDELTQRLQIAAARFRAIALEITEREER